MRRNFALFRFRVIEVSALRFRKEIHGRRTIAEIDVSSNTNNLIHARVLLWNWTEVLAYGFLLAKEFSRKRFVHHGHRPRRRSVRVHDGSSRHDAVSERFEKSRSHAGPTGADVVLRAWLRFALDADFMRPNPAAQRCLQYGADHTHTTYSAQTILYFAE